ncbi:Threonyl/alanyl tRNA synthetase [Mycotypha africana]|uniref:Threonyl/alanyl tRNA synthetase n=1 Tax=Mycotypha africana TaxID=64632 RepID=UPI002301558A|nr:Threonyl/alanyl tRNA synthetase [Mycotypha africana]KAI8973730.1 Threonyl/alanyl tRNA synthetase [Mycotypha africana]
MVPASEEQQAPVGDLQCQKDTFLQHYSTVCLWCSAAPDKKGFYQVKLQDTILFPEGGGQPSDTGYIDNIKVHHVLREGLSHIHFTKDPVPVGPVELKLDWDRRWDHVQQHSGQHLLSAVLEQPPYNIETISWNLGEKRSYIELPTSKVKVDISKPFLSDVESVVNRLILKNIPVLTHSEKHVDTNRPDSLPSDYTGGGHIRTIEIEGLDRNPCCGTHVSSLGQLQCLKLLHTEKVRGGNTRLFFLVGQRVLDTLDASYTITRQLTSLLSGPQEQFVENIERLQQQSKNQMKRSKRLLEQLAAYTVDDVGRVLKEQKVMVVYRELADMEFLSMVAHGIKDRALLAEGEKVLVLAAGEETAGGPIIVQGTNDAIVQKASQILMKTLPNVKGGGKGRWQGKAQSWQGIDGLEKVLKDEL